MADILVLNSNEDLIEILRTTLERAGWTVMTMHVREAKLRPDHIDEIMRTAQPRLVLLDIAPPYGENWAWYRTVFAPHPALQGRRVVVTTTNLPALREDGGPPDAVELLGKPYDLEQLIAVVRRALA